MSSQVSNQNKKIFFGKNLIFSLRVQLPFIIKESSKNLRYCASGPRGLCFKIVHFCCTEADLTEGVLMSILWCMVSRSKQGQASYFSNLWLCIIQSIHNQVRFAGPSLNVEECPTGQSTRNAGASYNLANLAISQPFQIKFKWYESQRCSTQLKQSNQLPTQLPDSFLEMPWLAII